MRETMTRLRLLPPILWTLLIAWLSADQWSGTGTGARLFPILHRLFPWAAPEALEALHWMIRKAAHMTEYAVLAGLWAWALGGWRRALALSVGTAFLDELGQSTTLSRQGSAADFLLDSASAAAALSIAWAGLERLLDFLTAALFWLGAAGGTVLLAVNVATGAPSGWLWVSVPVAWIALAVWTRARARGEPG
jgi:VanZ family protein